MRIILRQYSIVVAYFRATLRLSLCIGTYKDTSLRHIQGQIWHSHEDNTGLYCTLYFIVAAYSRGA